MMYHSVWFKTIPTHGSDYRSFDMYEDFGLVPTTRPVIPPPGVKTHNIEIPGTNGTVDLTESLTPFPLYQNRSGSIEFAVVAEHYYWADLYSKLMNYLHGHRAMMVLEDDRNWYYDGRFAVNSWNTGSGTCPTVAIDYDVGPYKLSVQTASQMDEDGWDWLWDPFSFYDGVINCQVYKTHSTSKGIFTNINVPSSEWKRVGVMLPAKDQIDDQIYGAKLNHSITGWMPTVPVLTFSDSNMGVKVENDQLGYTYEKTYNTSGTFIDPELILYDRFGGYDMYLKGPGTVSIDFRKGSL